MAVTAQLLAPDLILLLALQQPANLTGGKFLSGLGQTLCGCRSGILEVIGIFNGAMIAAQAYYEYLAGNTSDMSLNAYATKSILGEAL